MGSVVNDVDAFTSQSVQPIKVKSFKHQIMQNEKFFVLKPPT